MNQASIEQLFLFDFASQLSTLTENEVFDKISDEELDSIFGQMSYESALDHCISRCSLDIQKKYPGNHINWFNKEKIYQMLRNAGFNQVYESTYGASVLPVLRNIKFFDNTHPTISVYVEAIK